MMFIKFSDKNPSNLPIATLATLAEWLAFSAAGQLLVRRPPGSIPSGSSKFQFVAPLHTVNWVLMTGHEGNMGAVNRVFLLIEHWL